MEIEHTSSMSDEMKNKLVQFINDLIAKKETSEFRYPVDYVSMNLTDYPKIIKKPMDLNTLKSNITENKYATLEKTLDDLQLIWDNCKLYNVPYSKIHRIAVILEQHCEKLIKEVFGDVVYGKNNDSYKKLEEQKKQNYYEEEIEHNEKIEFTKKIRELEPQQLGHVVNMLKEKCPRAFHQDGENDCEILVDNISKSSYELINKYFDEIFSKKRIKTN